MRAVGDRSPPVGHVKPSQTFETRIPPKMLSFHPDPSSSFRAQLSSQALLKHGADADDGGDKASRDFVVPECVSKKEDITAAFWGNMRHGEGLVPNIVESTKLLRF